MKNENAQEITEGQKFDIAGGLVKSTPQIFDGVPFDVGKKFVETDILKGIFRKAVILYCHENGSEVVNRVKKSSLVSKLLTAQEKFYKEEFGKKCDFSGLVVPEAGSIFKWLMCMTEKVGIEELLVGGKNPQPSWKYTGRSLDEVVNMEFGRDGHKSPYIFRAKSNIEADENLKDISASKIVEIGIVAMGLKERLALGRFLYWFRKKKIILDILNWTLCSGSRYSDGGVPSVDYNPRGGKVHVSRCSVDSANSDLRSREIVVSCSPKANK